MQNRIEKTSRSPRGLTLIEFLAVIVIVGVIAALGIPAVFQAREAARRSHCANNLRQIGMALHAYEAQCGCFPPASNAGRGYSFFTMLLPQLEQGGLFDAMNFTAPVRPLRQAIARSANLTAAATTLDVLLCPSDGAARFERGSTNYAGNAGSGYQKYGANGFFEYQINSQRPVTSGMVTDGLSTTAAVAECLIGAVRSTDRRRLVLDTLTPLDGAEQLEAFASLCSSMESGRLASTIRGKEWTNANLGYTAYNHVLTPNRNSCLNDGLFFQGAWSAGSEHAGSNVMFADGHVHAVGDRCSLNVWRSLGSRNGAEIVEDSRSSL